jgi:ACS family pantothenate transporter-like MFS transporter
MFWAWTQETLSGDPATRAFAGAGLNVWASVSHAVIPLGLFQVVHQPAVVAGNYGAAGFAFLHTGTALSLAYLQHRRRRTARKYGVNENTQDSASDHRDDGGDLTWDDIPSNGVGTKTVNTTVQPAEASPNESVDEIDRKRP